VTETFCERSRFFQPANGARIDAVRAAIDERYAGSWLEPVLLTSLLEAADRVDSTTGVQMAYVKQWADRSFRPLELRVPVLLAGPGRAVRGDACAVASGLGHFDLAYLDPPYNQHRYDANYHIWETLVAWDSPDHYGVACKRTEIRLGERSAFNSRRTMPDALARVVRDVDARLLVLSYNDESWIELDALVEMCRVRGHVEVLAFASNRYVGARIGIHNPAGERVGSVGRLRNLEYVLVAGERAEVRRVVEPWRDSVVTARAS
jgi:adenine-specific DNA-methyltransferase